MHDSRPPWRPILFIGTFLTVAALAAAFIIPRLFPTGKRNLDGMIDTLGVVMACGAIAVVVAIVTTAMVAVSARQSGLRFPLAGLLPLGIIGGLIALGAAGIAYTNSQMQPQDEPGPVAAPAMPLQPKPAP